MDLDVTVYYRINYHWQQIDADVAWSAKYQNCTQYFVTLSEADKLSFKCENQTIYSVTIDDAYMYAGLGMQSTKKETLCI